LRSPPERSGCLPCSTLGQSTSPEGCRTRSRSAQALRRFCPARAPCASVRDECVERPRDSRPSTLRFQDKPSGKSALLTFRAARESGSAGCVAPCGASFLSRVIPSAAAASAHEGGVAQARLSESHRTNASLTRKLEVRGGRHGRVRDVVVGDGRGVVECAEAQLDAEYAAHRKSDVGLESRRSETEQRVNVCHRDGKRQRERAWAFPGATVTLACVMLPAARASGMPCTQPRANGSRMHGDFFE
jgi:hypothetical protein